MKSHERVHFRLYHMKCCGIGICWVNPRPPSYCPECGKQCFPEVKQWAQVIDDDAVLTVEQGVISNA